jgi:hypothetical protein
LKPDDVLLDKPELRAGQVFCKVVTTGKDHAKYLFSDMEEDLECAREDLENAGSDEAKRRKQEKIDSLETRMKEISAAGFLVEVRVFFSVPNEVYESYQSDTDLQYRLSSKFFDLLDQLLGEDKVKHHLFDIKILPADSNQFWREPKPTAANVDPATPPDSTPPDLHPLDKLPALFQEAIKA